MKATDKLLSDLEARIADLLVIAHNAYYEGLDEGFRLGKAAAEKDPAQPNLSWNDKADAHNRSQYFSDLRNWEDA